MGPADAEKEKPAEQSPAASRKPRILAVRRGALGDFVLTLPALRALRESRPGAEIHLLTLPSYGELAIHFGFADGWRSLESAGAAALFQENAEISAEWRDWLAGFDMVLSWLPDRDGMFQRRVMACRPASSSAEAVAFHQAPWLAEKPGVDAALQFGAVPGLTLDGGPHVLLPLTVSANADTPPRSKTATMTVALHPGSGSPRKNWPFDRWISIMTSLQRTCPGIRWLIITGEAEEERLPEMAAALDSAGLAWESAHALNLVPLTERLGQCAALLGHDSGISHLASACGLPCFLLFGPTDPAVWAPASPSTRVLRADGGDLQELPVERVAEWLTRELLGEVKGYAEGPLRD